MDRLRQPGAIAEDAQPRQATIARREATQNVCLFGPLHYEPGYEYPLIVWLHGEGGTEQDLKRVMPHISMRNFVGVAPRGTQPVTKRRFSFRWRQQAAAVAASRVLDAIDQATTRFSINDQRVFIGGFDCGATMAYRIAFSYPDRFAGVIGACGGFPSGRRPFARLTESRGLPVLMVCARDSQTYSSEAACADLRLFHVAGLDITLRQYPGDNGLSPAMLGDVNRWIMERLGAIN